MNRPSASPARLLLPRPAQSAAPPLAGGSPAPRGRSSAGAAGGPSLRPSPRRGLGDAHPAVGLGGELPPDAHCTVVYVIYIFTSLTTFSSR